MDKTKTANDLLQHFTNLKKSTTNLSGITKNLANSSSVKQKTGVSTKVTTSQGYRIDQFYIRLQSIYGKKFLTQFSSQQLIDSSKFEFASMILEQTPDHLNNRLGLVKRRRFQDQNLEWPDIAYILSMPTGVSPNGMNAAAYKEFKSPPRLTDQTAIEKNKESGAKSFSDMLSSLKL